MLNRASAFLLSSVVLLYPAIGAAQVQGRPASAGRAGQGIGGVEVGIRKKPGTHITDRQRTDKDGKFAFRNLAAGSYVLVLNPPPASSPEAKSYFESRSNMRVEVVVEEGGRPSDPLVLELVPEGSSLANARSSRDMSKSIIQNIKARQSAEKPNEVTVEITTGQTLSGRIALVTVPSAR